MVVTSGHINNLYNTLFWAMVQQGRMSEAEAELNIRVSPYPSPSPFSSPSP
jgi:hypothetical protein